MSTRSRSPLRYAPWLIRDLLVWPGVIYAAVAVLVGFIDWRIALRAASGHAGRFAMTPTAAGSQAAVWNTCLTIAILFAIGGVVGIDVHRGYYRSLFSKPMAPWWYYLQRYLLAGLMVMLAPVLLGASVAIALHGGTGLSGALFATIAMAYLLTGSLTLLCSIFRPEGWLLVFIAAFVQNMMANMLKASQYMNVEPPALMVWAHRILPPFDLLVPGGPALSGGSLAHVLIYGASLLMVALLLLRFRPLGTGGRS